MTDIQSSIAEAVDYLSAHPEEARYTDSLALANLGESLRVSISGSDGEQVTTDMPGAIGGLAEEPSPGWLYRAAIASCVASTVGMEAARSGLDLDSLAVEVDSESDDRGILGIDDSTPAGPLSVSVRIIATADGVPDDELREIVERGTRRCPVFDAIERSVQTTLHIQPG